MQTVTERMPLLSGHEQFENELPAHPDRVRRLRQKGRAVFEEIGVPTTRQEEWRKTNLAILNRTTFERMPEGSVTLSSDHITPYLIPGCFELVFINGRLSASHSKLEGLPKDVFAGSLAEALVEKASLVEAHLGVYADLEHPFVALNSAFIQDGALIHVPRGITLEKPVHVLFLASGKEGVVSVSYPRNLFIAEESSQVTIVESYGGYRGDQYFTCPVTEIVGQANSVVDHYRLGQESLGAIHIATQKVHLDRDTNFFSHSINHGGALVRNDIQAMLDAEGIHCTLNGLYLARGTQHVDHQMRVDHAKPNCHSYELFKGIMEDRSRAVFNGRIYVHQDAQKTDAKQSNQNLLLSKEALVHSNPQLEIFADDVRCTHGSTTGHLDEEAVFYLRSRGIGETAARSLLTYSFAGEVLDEVRLDSVRKDIEEFLFTRLPKGDIVRQAV